MDAMAWIAEQRIREAMERGFFDVPSYRGRRLRLEEVEGVPPEVQAVLRTLREAGCLPPAPLRGRP